MKEMLYLNGCNVFDTLICDRKYMIHFWIYFLDFGNFKFNFVNRMTQFLSSVKFMVKFDSSEGSSVEHFWRYSCSALTQEEYSETQQLYFITMYGEHMREFPNI